MLAIKFIHLHIFLDNYQFNLVKGALIYTLLKTCLFFVRSEWYETTYLMKSNRVLSNIIIV